MRHPSCQPPHRLHLHGLPELVLEKLLLRDVVDDQAAVTRLRSEKPDLAAPCVYRVALQRDRLSLQHQPAEALQLHRIEPREHVQQGAPHELLRLLPGERLECRVYLHEAEIRSLPLKPFDHLQEREAVAHVLEEQAVLLLALLQIPVHRAGRRDGHGAHVGRRHGEVQVAARVLRCGEPSEPEPADDVVVVETHHEAACSLLDVEAGIHLLRQRTQGLLPGRSCPVAPERFLLGRGDVSELLGPEK